MPTASDPETASTPRSDREALFLANLETVRSAAAAAARRYRLSPADAEDFVADVQCRLIDGDYAVLRKFRGQCSLRTYLTVVIRRLCQDRRAAERGRWRPSVSSRRAGEAVERLERLTMRDGLSFDEACATLEINHGLAVDRRDLARHYGRFRPSLRPVFVSEIGVDERGSAWAGARSAGADSWRSAAAADAVAAAVAALAPADRALLTRRFSDGMTVAAMARATGVSRGRLDRRLARVLRRLRRVLQAPAPQFTR
jgi:RNA polymerase sigma factor (sigma-70 family)